MRGIGLNFQKGRIRATIMDRDTSASITIHCARVIAIDPNLPFPELMDRYATQFRVLIDEFQPDLAAARQVWDINGVDAAVSQVAPFGIAAYVCNERNLKFCSYRLATLLKFAKEAAERKTGGPDTLFFPAAFAEYLRKYTYANFDPDTENAVAGSRHAVGHGAAPAESYTQIRALQAILTLDQLAFYT
jgi:hypothetical protein